MMGFPEKAMRDSRFVCWYSMNCETIFCIFSSRVGALSIAQLCVYSLFSMASIERDISSKSTMSIPFFVRVCV